MTYSLHQLLTTRIKYYLYSVLNRLNFNDVNDIKMVRYAYQNGMRIKHTYNGVNTEFCIEKRILFDYQKDVRCKLGQCYT